MLLERNLKAFAAADPMILKSFMSKSIVFNHTYDHPIEKVWAALTNAQALSQWLMPCDFEPILGHKFTFKTKSGPGFDGIVHCEVLEIKENESLSYSWKNGNLNTVVKFDLSELDGKTMLRLEQSGFQGVFENLFVKRILSAGWKRTLLTKKLVKYLEKNGHI